MKPEPREYPRHADSASWEGAVDAFRSAPENAQAVLDNYFDLPVLGAAQRYRSSKEFRVAAKLLQRTRGELLVDLGAGNGIASVAFALSGWPVVSIEPDPSDKVGYRAIRHSARHLEAPLHVVAGVAERIPLRDASVSAIFGRQMLHHLADLRQGCAEIERVLRPGGHALLVREHVVENADELAEFLQEHPLHSHYGGENAHPLNGYLDSLEAAGLVVSRVWGPLDSALNAYPMKERVRRFRFGLVIGRLAFTRPVAVSTALATAQVRWLVRGEDVTPGRLYSFLVRKP